MKKILATLLCTFAVVFAANAEDKPINLTQLPAVSQQFIKKHFSDKQFSYATKDTDLFDGEYKVVFADGDKVEFDSKGNWNDVECRQSAEGVPAAIIPASIQKYLTQHYKTAKVVDIEYDKEFRSMYEVKLNTGLELKFDKQGTLVGIDS